MKKAHPTLCLLFLFIPLCLLFGFLYYYYLYSFSLERDFVWAFFVKTNALFRTFSILFLTLSVFLPSSDNSEYTFPFHAMHRPLREGVLLVVRKTTKWKWFLRKQQTQKQKQKQNQHRDRKKTSRPFEPSHLCASFQINTAAAKKKNSSTAAAFVVVVSHSRDSLLSVTQTHFILTFSPKRVISDRENSDKRAEKICPSQWLHTKVSTPAEDQGTWEKWAQNVRYSLFYSLLFFLLFSSLSHERALANHWGGFDLLVHCLCVVECMYWPFFPYTNPK